MFGVKHLEQGVNWTHIWCSEYVLDVFWTFMYVQFIICFQEELRLKQSYWFFKQSYWFFLTEIFIFLFGPVSGEDSFSPNQKTTWNLSG